MKEEMITGAFSDGRSLESSRQSHSETTVSSKCMCFIFFTLAVCMFAGISSANAVEGEDMGKSAAQIGSGYAAHFAGNTIGNWMLDKSDDFPNSSLSSLSVVATSFAVSAGTSAAVYGAGQAFDDDSRSFGWTLLGGVSAVGSSSLVGALIGLDDWKSGAAVGSVIGRYFVPISATVFYYLRNGDKEKNDNGEERGKLIVPVICIRF